MIAEKTKAVAQTTAHKTEILKQTYYSRQRLSSLKLKQEIGEVLFYLEFLIEPELRCIGLGIIEKMLRNYVDLRISRGNL